MCLVQSWEVWKRNTTHNTFFDVSRSRQDLYNKVQVQYFENQKEVELIMPVVPLVEFCQDLWYYWK